MSKPIFNNKKVIEYTTNVTVPTNQNNVPCLVVNSGNLDKPNLLCVQNPNFPSSKVITPPTPDIRSQTVALSNYTINNTTNVTGPTIVTPPVINNTSAVIIEDPSFVKYTIIKLEDGATMPTEVPKQPLCNLINTGTKANPSLYCAEQITIKGNMPILPPIVPSGCLLVNTGTQTNPILSCAQILQPKPEEGTPIIPTDPVAPIAASSGSQTTGVASSVNLESVTEGTQTAGTLLRVQKANNPYTATITSLNKSINWSCPAGYVAQYPNQVLTECDSSGKCTDFVQNPSVLSQPCMGPATANFKYNKDPYGAMDINSDIQCQYGFPIFSGINNNGLFTGNVMCLYQKGEGQIL